MSYNRNGTSYTLSVPITLSRNRLPSASDGVEVSGDATFARRQFIFNISRKIGR